jgi:hypothetical protein
MQTNKLFYGAARPNKGTHFASWVFNSKPIEQKSPVKLTENVNI